jgi:hypothetical protein
LARLTELQSTKPLPDGWVLYLPDIVQSTAPIKPSLQGPGTPQRPAVANTEFLLVFGGDCASFAVAS